MSQPHSEFAVLGSFTTLSFDAAEERFSLSETDDDPPAGYNVLVSDLFGDAPDHVFVMPSASHPNDVTINVAGDYAGMYIIDGDLVIQGTLDLCQTDGASILLVTGALTVDTLVVSEEAQLWVAGNLNVKKIILAGLSDAGGLAVKGTISAETFINLGEEVLCAAPPKAQIIEGRYGPGSIEEALIPPFNEEETNVEVLAEALRKGLSILRQP